MRYQPLLLLIVCCLTVGALAGAGTPPSLAETVQASRWKKRTLLVVAPSTADPAFRQQQELLSAVPRQLRERDFLVLSVCYDQLGPADRRYLQQKVGLKTQGFAVVLIGKDGGIKQVETQPLTPAALFGTVDKMPMRRQEMGR